MEGTEVVDVIALPNLGDQWRIAGAGNFNSDATTDILWYRDRGRTARVWLMGDVAGANEFDRRVASGWVIAGVGDFDGEGRTEIALWNQSSRVEIWGLDDELVRIVRFSIRKNSNVVGFGDVDGDGDDDVIIQDSRKRKIGASLMSADFSSQQVLFGKLPTPRDVIDSGDYDGDDRSEFLWREFSLTGGWRAGITHLSKNLELDDRSLELDLGDNGSVVGSADYDGDGNTDLLVFDRETRELVLWLLDGLGVYRYESLGTIAENWAPMGFNTDDSANR